MTDIYKHLRPENCYHKIYWESNSEFEEIRDLVLSEGNWLGENYTKKNLLLEDRRGYSVVFSKETHEPMVMGGVYACGLWNPKVARHLDRVYTFPQFRNHSFGGIYASMTLVKQHIIDPLIEVNNYESYFISMQSRYNKKDDMHWKIWKKAFFKNEIGIGWEEDNKNMVRCCSADVQKCYQNFIYINMNEDDFFQKNMSKCLISKTEWETLPRGI